MYHSKRKNNYLLVMVEMWLFTALVHLMKTDEVLRYREVELQSKLERLYDSGERLVPDFCLYTLFTYQEQREIFKYLYATGEYKFLLSYVRKAFDEAHQTIKELNLLVFLDDENEAKLEFVKSKRKQFLNDFCFYA